MMNILAFDTCFDACSVAVQRADTGAVSTERELMRRGHAEALLPMMERTMREAALGFADLDRIAVTHGPGTFTGARVGMAAALGLSFAHGTPVVTLSSLRCVALAVIDALGDHAQDFDGVLVARDARRDSVFVEMTDIDGTERVAPSLLSIVEARQLVAGRRFFAVGSGVPLLAGDGNAAAVMPSVFGQWPVEPPLGTEEPDARFLLRDAAVRPPSTTPVPLYLRPPDATPSSKPPLERLNADGPAPNSVSRTGA